MDQYLLYIPRKVDDGSVNALVAFILADVYNNEGEDEVEELGQLKALYLPHGRWIMKAARSLPSFLPYWPLYILCLVTTPAPKIADYSRTPTCLIIYFLIPVAKMSILND